MLKSFILCASFLCMMSLPAIAADAKKDIKVKVTVKGHVLTATFLDNETTRALVAKFPLTVSMMDLYSREMCYRFPDALPANEVITSGYAVGDIVY